MEPEVLGPILDVFAPPGGTATHNETSKSVITPDSVFQPGDERSRSYINGILDKLVLPESMFSNVEHLDEFYKRSRNGSPCLILMEHYSNFDIPCLYYLLSQSGRKDVADHITAIAGMKLNEESGFVNSFAQAYTRLVIYPSRALARLQETDPHTYEKEELRSRQINMAATRAMIRLKHEGHLVLVFPSGTRYREGEPETKRGVKEVDSYIKSFEHVIFIGVAGNVLRIHPTGDMKRDLATRDLMVLRASPIVSCSEFRSNARAGACADDPKQCVADAVMHRLEELHAEAEVIRKERLSILAERT
jgi:glycerol-3-phosphate O-acyltransferase